MTDEDPHRDEWVAVAKAAERLAADGGDGAPLCAALDRLSDAIMNDPVTPPGWKLVPIEPTREMIEAVDGDAEDKYVARGRAVSAWVSMIAAAPTPPFATNSLPGEPT